MAGSERVTRKRMGAVQRRQQILEAAMRAFAQEGYNGTTTDQVAREAGVSQPYVVRTFGTKLQLFIEVFRAAGEAVLDTIDSVVQEPVEENDLGQAYLNLLADSPIRGVLMHGFMAGHIPEIGATAREFFSRIYTLLLEQRHMEPEQAADFIARGMMINTMMAIDMPKHLGDAPENRTLMVCLMGEDIPSSSEAAENQ